jgi:uncharacterized protein (DUF433 family)
VRRGVNMDETDIRVRKPICTVADVAELVDMPRSTVYSWRRPTNSRDAVVHSVTPERRGWPSVPLVGLAEAHVLRSLRDVGMPMDELAAAATYIREREGTPFALSNPRLVTDGVKAYIQEADNDIRTLRENQQAFPEVLRDYLRPLVLDRDGFAEAFKVLRLPGVVIDPRYSSGRMRFVRTGVPVFAVAGELAAGEDPGVVASGYGLTDDELRLVVDDLPWLSEVA